MTDWKSGYGDPVDILGVPVTPWEPRTLIDTLINAALARSAADRVHSTVHYANPHVVNIACRNAELRTQLARASTVYCDGSGIRLGAAVLGRRLPPRLTAADWIDAFCEHAARAGVRLFIVAGAEGIAQRAAGILEARHAGLQIVGAHHGYLDDTASERVITRANEADTDLMLVGMGTPKQELWVARHRHEIQAPVVWTVGALFDVVAGTQRRAPALLRAAHLEWLWRLGTAPRRLGSRYLLGNPLFCMRVVGARLDPSRTKELRR